MLLWPNAILENIIHFYKDKLKTSNSNESQKRGREGGKRNEGEKEVGWVRELGGIWKKKGWEGENVIKIYCLK